MLKIKIGDIFYDKDIRSFNFEILEMIPKDQNSVYNKYRVKRRVFNQDLGWPDEILSEMYIGLTLVKRNSIKEKCQKCLKVT
jgi:hypothetical protein